MSRVIRLLQHLLRRTVAPVVLLAAGVLPLALGLLVAAPAESAGQPWRAVMTFQKNQQAPNRSSLTWRLSQRQASGTWKVVETLRWRSGSGIGGRAGRDSCARNQGWLPNGSYRVRQYDDYPGTLIKGRAFRLDDHACPDGTRRTALFIHTEQGAGNRQCPDRPGDQVCRWEVPRIDDYRSLGCIKLAPGDLAALVRAYERHFATGTRYPVGQVVLRVVG
ncbi:MAG: hypothetical protein JWR42_2747 [Marmoricola sp.]|nr:hypothetical protein [Marmoricola sp.]